MSGQAVLQVRVRLWVVVYVWVGLGMMKEGRSTY